MPALHLGARRPGHGTGRGRGGGRAALFVVYQRVGEEILHRTRLEGHPYAAWISTYADPGFAEAAGRAAAVCDELAEAAGDEIRRRMTDLFVRCTKMEWLFWDSAWNLEKWNI